MLTKSGNDIAKTRAGLRCWKNWIGRGFRKKLFIHTLTMNFPNKPAILTYRNQKRCVQYF
ncbi:hypothetical protein HMPREF3156_02583, partial [Neisseria sp. HMSC06F02]